MATRGVIVSGMGVGVQSFKMPADTGKKRQCVQNSFKGQIGGHGELDPTIGRYTGLPLFFTSNIRNFSRTKEIFEQLLGIIWFDYKTNP